MAIITIIRNKFLSGHERSVKAKKNMIALLLLKGYSMVVNLALVPLTLKLLDDYKYGVWITLFNVISWISIFDIGIGNGLRNKFAESIANNRINDAKEYVSTSYFMMFGISFILILIFIIPWLFIDWGKVFNVQSQLNHEVFMLVGISFFLVCLSFGLKLIGTLLTANHQPALSALLGSITNTVILLIFIVWKNSFKENLIGIGTIYTAVPLIVFILSSLILFNGMFFNVKPNIHYFNIVKVRSLLSLGLQFFIIQIAVIVIFTTDSMIISHTLSPKDVTSYNIVLRYFSVVSIVVGIIMTPFWSAYTEAAAKMDFDWIKGIVVKQIKSIIIVIILVIILLFNAKIIIPLWLNNNILISNSLIIGMSIYTIISVWNNIFAFLLNGLSKPFLSSLISVFAAIINIPVSIFFIKSLSLGNSGVIWGTILSLSFGVFLGPLQVFKILNNRAKGIWNR